MKLQNLFSKASFLFIALVGVGFLSIAPLSVSAWDLSTGSYDSKFISFSSQATGGPFAMTFKSDGTKLYFIGLPTLNNPSVFQYSLSTPWDISTASYDSVSLNISAYEIRPSGISFHPDGTKMFIGGYGVDKLMQQYTLSTPWDLSTASYDSLTFSVSSQANNPYGFTIGNSGTSMYVVNSTDQKAYQYTFGTAWDITTLSYASKEFNLSANVALATGVTFNTDGTSMYVSDYIDRYVEQYTLSTPWDVTTASFASKRLNASSQTTQLYAHYIGKNGTKVFAISASDNRIYQYSLTDTTPPTITSISSDKTNGSYKAGEVIDIDVTFSEAVTSTGNVTVTLETGATDRTCTFTVTNATTGTCNYTVQAGDTTNDLDVLSISGTIADESSNAMVNFVPATNLAANKALVIDTAAPVVDTLSPADNATGVVFNPTLAMTFDEPVVFDNGNITVYQASDNAEIVSIPVAGGIANTTASVSFLELLEPSTEYYVLVSATAIADESGNNFAGISDATAWSFTTRAVNDPILTYPANNSAYQSSIEIDYEIFEAPLANSIQLIFTGDETITINLVDVGVGSHDFTLDVTDIGASIAVASSSQNTIPDGVYNVTLRHRDLLDAVTLSTISTNVVIDTIAPILTVVSSPSSNSTIAQARLYFTTNESCTPLAEAPLSSTGPVESIISETLVGVTNYATISGMQVGGVYSFSFLCRDNSNNSSNLLTFGPVTIIAEPTSPTNTTRTSVGSSVQGRVQNLTIMGNTEAANKLIQQYPQLFTQATTTPPLGEPGLCSVDQTLTQNLRAPSRNGVFNSYTQGIVREAKILQAHLNRLGFNSGPEDGILGPISTGAIKRMQTFLGTRADGYVGPITRGLLNNSCGSAGLSN